MSIFQSQEDGDNMRSLPLPYYYIDSQEFQNVYQKLMQPETMQKTSHIQICTAREFEIHFDFLVYIH